MGDAGMEIHVWELWTWIAGVYIGVHGVFGSAIVRILLDITELHNTTTFLYILPKNSVEL